MWEGDCSYRHASFAHFHAWTTGDAGGSGPGLAPFDPAAVGLVGLDLDGTLCRSDGTVSPRNKAVLAELRRAGVSIVMATGRPSEAAKRMPKMVNVPRPTPRRAGRTCAASRCPWMMCAAWSSGWRSGSH